jgi:hypothetical protein
MQTSPMWASIQLNKRLHVGTNLLRRFDWRLLLLLLLRLRPLLLRRNQLLQAMPQLLGRPLQPPQHLV